MLRLLMSFLGGIFSMLTLGLAMAAATLGAVFFMYGRDLPSYETLAQYSPPTISRVYSAEGRIIDEFAEERRLFTPVEDIPDLVKHAFIAAEDQNFYVHPGFDLRGMAAAFVEAVRSRGQDLRGASTITQQVMKNFLLDGSRTAERKIKEIILAIRIERAMSKDDILELYLNEIFLGQNSYGVTAAAQTYFNKPLTELTPGEAAYLAALAQRPGNLHPVRNNADAVARRNYVLRRMAEATYGDADPTAIFYTGRSQVIEKDGDGYRLIQPLPFISKDKIQLTRTADELVVRIGNQKRNLILPRALVGLEILSAKHEDDLLTITFGPRQRERIANG